MKNWTTRQWRREIIRSIEPQIYTIGQMTKSFGWNGHFFQFFFFFCRMDALLSRLSYFCDSFYTSTFTKRNTAIVSLTISSWSLIKVHPCVFRTLRCIWCVCRHRHQLDCQSVKWSAAAWQSSWASCVRYDRNIRVTITGETYISKLVRRSSPHLDELLQLIHQRWINRYDLRCAMALQRTYRNRPHYCIWLDTHTHTPCYGWIYKRTLHQVLAQVHV